jgi:thiol-disulfide isomerase/thioredoxin
MQNPPGALTAAAALAAMVAGGFVADRALRADGTTSGHDTEAPAAVALAPAIALPGLEGNTIRLTDFTGRPVLVNFWATWCKPCRREIPLLIELRQEYAEQGLQILGVAIDELEPTRAMATEYGINYPVVVGEQEGIDALVAFGAPTTALPYTAIVDRDGRVLGGHVGELDRDEAMALLERVY